MLFASFHKSKEEINDEYAVLKRSMQNPDHFAPIYNKYYSEIFGFVFKRIADEDVTADITSIVFYKALYNLKKFKFRGLPFSSWLYRIAINSVNEHYRKEKKNTRFVTIEPEQIGSFLMDLNLDETEDMEARVVELLGMLKPVELQIIELRFFENCSYREIGDILSLSETNSKTKTFRILKKLKQFYDSKWQR